jgi:hypothetical protein
MTKEGKGEVILIRVQKLRKEKWKKSVPREKFPSPV